MNHTVLQYAVCWQHTAAKNGNLNPRDLQPFCCFWVHQGRMQKIEHDFPADNRSKELHQNFNHVKPQMVFYLVIRLTFWTNSALGQANTSVDAEQRCYKQDWLQKYLKNSE